MAAQDSVVVKVIHPDYEVATTADGNGADAQLSENDNGDTGSGAGATLNARFNDDTRNEVIALRFDLGGMTLAEIDTAALELISHRGQDQTRNLRVYGVHAGTTGGDNNGLTPGYTDDDWSESAVRFSTLPGLLWDGDSTTRGLNASVLTDLGGAGAGNLSKGDIVSFGSPALAGFLRSHPDSLVTLLINSDTVAEGQSRWASSEETELDGGTPAAPAGWFAPYLSVRAGESLPPGAVITNVTVTTATGAGADAELQENSSAAGELATSTGSNGDTLNSRTGGGNRNEIIALRFDLTGYNLADMDNVTLSVIQYRNDNTGGNPRQVALYGLRSDALPSQGLYTADDWDEAMVEFATMPGLIFDEDSTTQGIDPSKAVALGQISYAPNAKGGMETFSDPAITSFLRNDTGGNRVTFLLAAAPGYTSTGQARIASKEAAALADNSPSGARGDFAPRLDFQTIFYPEITLTSYAMAEDQLTLTWIGGTGPFKLQRKTSLAGDWADEITGIEGTEVSATVSGDSGFFRLRGQ